MSLKAMAPRSSTLAWKIPWAEEPGGLQSMGSLGVRHDWATSLSLFTFLHWRRKWQPTPVFLPGESQGRGSLVGCHLWGCTVGHDWSVLAAAAASVGQLPGGSRCILGTRQQPCGGRLAHPVWRLCSSSSPKVPKPSRRGWAGLKCRWRSDWKPFPSPSSLASFVSIPMKSRTLHLN